MKERSITVVPRRDTLDNWNKLNPVPKDKELCVVLTKSNKCKYKIGDGITPFKKLRYIKKISGINELLAYAIVPVNSMENEYVRIVTHIVLDPYCNIKYGNNIEKKNPYNFDIIKKTQEITGDTDGDPNESSEELPTEPLEK